MIFVTGSLWANEGYRSIGVVCSELAIEAKKEAILTLYTPGKATETAEDLIKTIVGKGVLMSIIVNQWDKQPKSFRDLLLSIKQQHRMNLKIYDFKSSDQSILHAKILVVDRTKAIIGSSNLSWSAMYNNYEIAALLEGKEAEKVAKLIMTLVQSRECREILPEHNSK